MLALYSTEIEVEYVHRRLKILIYVPVGEMRMKLYLHTEWSLNVKMDKCGHPCCPIKAQGRATMSGLGTTGFKGTKNKGQGHLQTFPLPLTNSFLGSSRYIFSIFKKNIVMVLRSISASEQISFLVTDICIIYKWENKILVAFWWREHLVHLIFQRNNYFSFKTAMLSLFETFLLLENNLQVTVFEKYLTNINIIATSQYCNSSI